MKWAHLPEPGGIYNQHPTLLEEWSIIFEERGKFQAEEERKRKREQGNSSLKRPRRR